MKDFHASEKSKLIIPTLVAQIQEFAIEQANEFCRAGQKPDEAASIVANILIRTAWVVAASGAIHSGRKPNPSKFRSAVKYQLDSMTFQAGDLS